MFSKQELIDAANLIRPYIHKTPVLTSTLVNESLQCEVFFKCENFQKMGAFKMRGASHALLSLTDEQKSKGVHTHSSGNFAQAIAIAAREAGIIATIVMPRNAPLVKKQAVLSYGARIIECDPSQKDREQVSEKIGRELGSTFVHPSNQNEVILGNATAAMELIEECEELDAILTPVGGGGLIAGTALAAHYFSEQIKVYGAEPSEADDALRSFKEGVLFESKPTNTIADGLKSSLGDITFPLIQKYVQDIFLVEEEEIISAMEFIWQRMKIIIEASSAVAYAGLLKNKNLFREKKVGIIITGGNVDLANLPFI